MRKIMFRGKTLDDGKWVYGYYVHQYGADEIYLFEPTDGFDSRHIDPNTAGEYTGFIDKNGKEIFTGDIVIGKTRKIQYDKFVGEAIFAHGNFRLRYPDRYGIEGYCWHTIGRVACDPALGWRVEDGVPYDYEIIGNIYDNPEKLHEEVKW